MDRKPFTTTIDSEIQNQFKSKCAINGIKMNDMAKLATKNGIKIGRTRLFNFLREKKVLGCRDGHKNMPYQRYIDTQPWFQLKESSYIQNGEVRIGLTPMVTPKGQSGIIRMLRKCKETS